MYSSNSFNSSYQFAESLCYTTSIPPPTSNNRGFSHSYPTSQVRPIVYNSSRRNYRRSYAWTSNSDNDMSEKKRQSSSFLGSSYGGSYIDYDSDSDSESDYDSDSGSTLNNDTIPSPSVLSEATIYSSTFCSSADTSMKSNFSPRQKVVSFSEEVDIIKPPTIIENSNKKNILKKALKIIKIKKEKN